MKEDQMLFCLIAFVLGFLINHMTRGSGLMVGGRVGELRSNRRGGSGNWRKNKIQELDTEVNKLHRKVAVEDKKIMKEQDIIDDKNVRIDNQIGRLEDKNKIIKDLRDELKELNGKINRQDRIEQCMRRNKDNGSMKQICKNYDKCERKHG